MDQTDCILMILNVLPNDACNYYQNKVDQVFLPGNIISGKFSERVLLYRRNVKDGKYFAFKK